MQYFNDLSATTKGFELLEEKLSPSASWKSLKIRGIFQRADAKNQNGRVYPRNVLEKALFEIKDSLAARNIFGELDHPESGSPTVNLRNVSHIITELHFQGNELIGTAVVMDDPSSGGTPNGRILGALIRNDGVVGISSRGLGAVTEDRHGETIVTDYKLVTFDAVADPSTQNAYISPMLEARNRLQCEIREAHGHDKRVRELREYLHSLLSK